MGKDFFKSNDTKNKVVLHEKTRGYSFHVGNAEFNVILMKYPKGDWHVKVFQEIDSNYKQKSIAIRLVDDIVDTLNKVWKQTGKH